MGGFISTDGIIEKEIMRELKQVKLEDISSLRKYYDEAYPKLFSINIVEFQKVFSEILNHWKEIFEKMKGTGDKVDVFEIFAIIIIFSRGQFNDKLNEIFHLFDFDDSGDIDFSELVLTIQSTTRGITKLFQLPIPTQKDIKILSLRALSIIDVDENEFLCFEEFSDWIISDEDIQEFLLVYANFQTRENALKKYEQYFNMYMECFKCLNGPSSTSFEEEKTPSLAGGVSVDDLKIKFLSVSEYISEEDANEIFTFLDKNKAGKINLQVYTDSMRALSSFLATDINHDNELEPHELRTLLWLTEGIEPTEQRVSKELKTMDIDRNGTISITEWIQYLSTIDPVTGVVYFDFELKRKFDMYDISSSGEISIDELNNMLRDAFEELVQDLNTSDRIAVEKLVADLAKTIMQNLDIAETKTLRWTEFKKYMHTAAENEQKIRLFIKRTYLS